MMDEASNKVHTSLPANYVTLVDLKERWMQQQKAKKGDEEIGEKERDPNSKVQGEGVGVGDGNQQDKRHQAPENSRLQSNPNPRPSTRRPSHGNRRPIQVTQPNPPTEFPGNQTKRASIVKSKQLKPLPPPVVQKIGAKEAPANRIIQSKPPLLDTSKVESNGEIHSSGKIAQKKTPRRNNKINDEEKLMDQSSPEKCAKENTEQGVEAGKVNKDADDNNGYDKIVQKKKHSRYNKRNYQKKDMDQSPSEKCAKENPEQGFEAGKVNKDADDNIGADKIGQKKKPSRNNKRNDEKKENSEQGFEAGKVNKDADDYTGADKIAQKKKPSRNNKRNDEKKDVNQSSLEKCAKENPEQEFEAGKVDKDADDNTGAEIVGRIPGLSLSSRTWEKSGCKSMAVRYGRPLRKENVGGYGKFEGRFMPNKDRARSANGLVWVKKGEAPLIGAVQMEETGFHK